MAHYTEIDSSIFEAFLVGMGFSRALEAHGSEVVFQRASSKVPGCIVKVYSSIRDGETSARDVGKDAVRIVGVFQSGEKSYPLYKGARVYRTTSQASVHQRTLSRIEEADARFDQWANEQVAKRAQRTETVSAPSPQASSEKPASKHVGALNSLMRVVVEVIARKEYNGKFLFTMRDAEGHTLAYWSLRDILQVGQKYDIGCKVVGFNTFQGVKQTLISDVVGRKVEV